MPQDLRCIQAPVRIIVLELGEDDPRKCTGLKLCRLGLANRASSPRSIPGRSILLNPYAPRVLTRLDRGLAERHGIVVVDCSWKRASDTFARARFKGANRRLPHLIAGNPINYGQVGMLSSVEAVAAALYILGYAEAAKRTLSIFKWGSTFLALNQELLDEYGKANSESEALSLEGEFFKHIRSDLESCDN